MAHMTVPADTARRSYVAAAAQVEFAIPFPFFTTADITVFVGGTQVYSGFTISGTLVDGGYQSGLCTFAAAPGVGVVVALVRDTPIARATDFPYPSRTLDIRSLNTDLDRLTVVAQEFGEDAGRALRVAPNEASIGTLPVTAARASKVLGFDALGNPVAVTPAAGTLAVTPYAQGLLSAGDARTARTVLGAGQPVYVTDFGAVGDGVTSNDAAFAAAFAAVPSGGAVLVPGASSTYRLSAAVNASNRRLVWQALPSGPGSIAINNGLQAYERGTFFPTGTAFGAGWNAYSLLSSTSTDTFNGTRTTQTISRTATGSGTNGPAYADVAQHLAVEKTDYLTSNVEGEIDGLVISVRQGKRSDAAGMLVDLVKVGGTSGGALAIETANARVDAAGAPVMRIQAAVNFLEGAGGASGGTGYGFWTEAQLGGPFSAFHADQVGGGTLWQNLISFGEARTAVNFIYRVDGTGRTYAPNGSVALPAYSFQGDPNTGMYLVGADTLGVATGGTGRWGWGSGGAYYPLTDNAYPVGGPANRATVLYATTGTINTSDETEKQDIEAVPDAWLDAWGDVQWARFRWKAAVAEKGDGARWHVGLIAQRVRDAFAARGLNAQAIGLLCFDRWEADAALGREAGERWGVRYEEALSLEAAYSRREMARMRAAMAPLLDDAA